MKRYTLYIHIFLRSFFIQGCWNYKGMLAVGFCFTLKPLAKLLYWDDPEKYYGFLKRHLGFMNGHPYFVSYALGASTKIEEMIAKGQGHPEQLQRFKNALVGPLGALGDQLFWAIIKPATFSLGVLFFLLVEDIQYRVGFIIFMGVLYNVPHLYIRIKGFKNGYQQGFNIYKFLKIENYKSMKRFYVSIVVLSLAFTIGYVGANWNAGNAVSIAVLLSSILIARYLRAEKGRSILALTVPAILSLIIGITL